MSRDISNHIYIIGPEAAVARFETFWCADARSIFEHGGHLGSGLVLVKRAANETDDEDICAANEPADTDICAEYSSYSDTNCHIARYVRAMSLLHPDVTVLHDWVVWDDDGETVLQDGGQQYEAGEKQFMEPGEDK